MHYIFVLQTIYEIGKIKVEEIFMHKIYKLFCLVPLVFVASCSTGGNTSPEEDIPQCDEHSFHLDSKIDPSESQDGKIINQCGLCSYKQEIIIPKLDSSNYIVTNLTASCDHGNGKRYYSEEYGEYIVDDNERTLHTVYGDRCETCNQLVGEFNFENFTSFTAGGYPRLYRLSEYWNNAWLLGADNGSIILKRSENEGETWGSTKTIASKSGYALANVDFFELPNHDIICSYRAIGNGSGTNYLRKICYSISRDGGLSWEAGGDIVDNYTLAIESGHSESELRLLMAGEGRLGFFEPYVDYINNVPTVIYADDFTPSLEKVVGSATSQNYRAQYLMSQTFDIEEETWSTTRVKIMDGSVKKSPTGSGLDARISRDGMPVFTRMKDGTYVLVFEGTYRDSDYNQLTGKSLSEYHPFEILMSYSKDGVTWSNPVEVYVPKNNRSKASAPFICVNDKDQLIISFQTDEDAVNSGYVGDSYSVMKVMVSKPGVNIENINKDSFYAVTNVNNTPVGSSSLWNGMMLHEGKLYTCSSGNKIKVSDIPLYANKEDYEVQDVIVDGNKSTIMPVANNYEAFSSGTSTAMYSLKGVTLDNSPACEQKLKLTALEVGTTYQIDFDLETTNDRDVNFGFYLGAKNFANGQDKIDSLNVHLERLVDVKSWGVHIYNFEQSYQGQLANSSMIATDDYNIKVRMIVNNNNIKVMIDDMERVVLDYTASSQFNLSGVLGIRNQGNSCATMKNFSITQ